MWDWIHRSQQRQRDLQQGVDADLVQANRRRWKLCAWLFGLFFVSIGVQAFAKFSGIVDRIALGITAVLLFGAIILGRWASAWAEFLDRPDPKEPPRLWKWGR
jgi:hypothetical protein